MLNRLRTLPWNSTQPVGAELRDGGATGVRAFLAGAWQIPLLLAGAALLWVGVSRQVDRYRPVSFEEHVARVGVLREADALPRAATYIKYLLSNTRRTPDERAELFRLYGLVAYQSESKLSAHSDGNIRAIITNLQRAQSGGAKLAAGDWLALGEAYRWAGRWPKAIEALVEALNLGVSQSDSVRRKVVEMRLATVPITDPKNVADVAAVLEAPGTLATNYLWAVDLTVERLLTDDKFHEAHKLVKAAEARLAGSEHRHTVQFLEALCLRSMGRAEEAEALLRSLRNTWTTHDELWGRCGWLLARLQQDDDRPQQALSFYEEVLRSFVTGDLKWACELGRAECLSRLERYDAALDVFSEIVKQRSHWERSRYLDAGAVRSGLVVFGEALRKSGAFERSNAFYRLGLTLAGSSADAQRAHYLGQIAENCRALAVMARDAGETAQAAGWFAEAGRLQFERSDIETKETFQAEALERAAENFDEAGRTEDMLSALSRLVARHPTNVRRSAGMFRLAQGLEAQGRYAEAADAYQEIITVYRRLPDALASMVPLARCLIRQGGAGSQRGVDMLTNIVDDLGPEEIFTPQATEYRQALFELAEYYARADDGSTGNGTAAANQHELAISRLEDALALYPDATEAPKLLFLLAESYRQSALKLRKAASAQTDPPTREDGLQASSSRLRRASATYDRLIARLAGQDTSALSEVEQSYLRSSYLYRADCLFELGEYAGAIDAYREAQWRYESLPTALAAGVQIHHGYARLGNAAEARVALARMKWLLKKMPASVFEAQQGMSSKAYWEKLLARLEQTDVASATGV